MSTCATCKTGFNSSNKITCCICCHELYHASESCANLSGSELKIFELKTIKPLMVFRCYACTTSKKSEVLTDFQSSISDLRNSVNKIEANISLINDNISELKSLQQMANTNKNDIAILKMETNKIDPLINKVAIIENLIEDISKGSVITNSNNADIPVDEKTLSELKSRVDKERNFLIFNFQDCKDAYKNDLGNITRLLNDSGLELPFSVDDIKVARLGKKFINGKNRILKVTLPSSECVHWIFRNKNSIGDGSLKIRSDLTVQQMGYRKKIFEELDSRRSNGEQDLCVKWINNVPVIKSNKKPQ